MALILGIETSCDETAAAVFDTDKQQLRSNAVFSQISMHKIYGGVVPEIAARTQFEKIDIIIKHALDEAQVTLDDIDTIGVTTHPGLVGSLLIGLSFAKGMAFGANKKIIGVNHLEGHIFSSFLKEDGSIETNLKFPFLCMSVSGGHTSIYIVRDFGSFELVGSTLDDAAGEAFDKVSQLLGCGYPGGPIIEKFARTVDNQDFFNYPRHKNPKTLDYSFSGLKTAVLYDLVKRGAFNLKTGIIKEAMNDELRAHVSSSLQVCITDMFEDRARRAFKLYPELTSLCFVGGVASNRYIAGRLRALCTRYGKEYFSPPLKFCTDNGAMIAFVASYKAARGEFDDLTLDVKKLG